MQTKPKSSPTDRESDSPLSSREAPGPGDSAVSTRDAMLGREGEIGHETSLSRGGGLASGRPSMFPRTSAPAPRTGPARPDVLADAARRARLEAPTVLDSEPGAFLFGAWRNVFVGVWESQATIPAVDRMVKATNTLSELYPTGRSTIHIVAHGAALPTADVRTYFANTLKKNADNLACVAVVIGGTGFWTSALRSFVTGLRWIAPRSFDFRLCGSTLEVARWLPTEHNKRTGIDVESRRLVQVLDGFADSRRR